MNTTEIITAVCYATGVTHDRIFSRSRLQEVVAARHFLCYELRMNGYTNAMITRVVKLDHATVTHAYNKFISLLSISDPLVVKYIDNYRLLTEDEQDREICQD